MKYPLYFICALLLLIGGGCRKKEFDQPLDKTFMRTCIDTDVTTIDPRKNGDLVSSTFNFLVYEGLTRIRPDGSAELALAENIDLSEDGKTYLFHLRDAKWTDGSPITAHDFEYSWKKIASPSFGSPCPHLLYPVRNVEKAVKGLVSVDEIGVYAIDEKTLRVELENPTPYFLSLITFCNFFPIAKSMELENPSWERDAGPQLLFSGPFVLEKWERNKQILLRKNPAYWNAKNVRLDEIALQVISDAHTALQMFENKELDFISTSTTRLSSSDLKHCKEKGLLRISPMGGFLFLTFNLERPPFNNPNIRKAMALSIDWEHLIRNVSELSETAARRVIPPVLINGENRNIVPGHNPSLALECFEKGLLELGIDRKTFSKMIDLIYPVSDLYRSISLGIQHGWKECLGIEISLADYELNVLYKKFQERDFTVGTILGVAQYNDANNVLERFKNKEIKKNFPGFENQDYIELLDKAAQTNDPVERIQFLNQAEDILIAEMPLYPIYHFNNGALISDRFENVEFSPLGNLLFKNLIPRESWH